MSRHHQELTTLLVLQRIQRILLHCLQGHTWMRPILLDMDLSTHRHVGHRSPWHLGAFSDLRCRQQPFSSDNWVLCSHHLIICDIMKSWSNAKRSNVTVTCGLDLWSCELWTVGCQWLNAESWKVGLGPAVLQAWNLKFEVVESWKLLHLHLHCIYFLWIKIIGKCQVSNHPQELCGSTPSL